MREVTPGLRSWVGCALAVGLLACGDSTAGGGGADGAPIPFVPLAASQGSCHGSARAERTLRDTSAWSAWWTEAHCGGGPNRPEVDFSRDMVIAVQDRTGPSGCYAVRIAEIRRAPGGGYAVRVNRHVPTSRSACTLALVHPAHAVRAPLVRGPVRFEWRVVEGPPGDAPG